MGDEFTADDNEDVVDFDNELNKFCTKKMDRYSPDIVALTTLVGGLMMVYAIYGPAKYRDIVNTSLEGAIEKWELSRKAHQERDL